MKRRLNLILSLVLGFFGGALSPYISSQVVRAQTTLQAPKEIRAQSFVLVNANRQEAGIFGFDNYGQPEITLVDPQGKIMWSTQLRAVMNAR
jgi:hypothetical protein